MQDISPTNHARAFAFGSSACGAGSVFVECRGLIVLPTAGSEHLRGPSCAQCFSGGSAEAGLLKRTSHTLTPNHPTHTMIAERSVDIVTTPIITTTSTTTHRNNTNTPPCRSQQCQRHLTLTQLTMGTPMTSDVTHVKNMDPKGHPTDHMGQHSKSALTMATAMAMTKATTIHLKRRRRRRRRSHRPQ